MKTPQLLWLYLVFAFGCLILLVITVRSNLEFIKKVKANKQCKNIPKQKTTEIWNYIGIGALSILLILLFVALGTEVRDENTKQKLVISNAQVSKYQ